MRLRKWGGGCILGWYRFVAQVYIYIAYVRTRNKHWYFHSQPTQFPTRKPPIFSANESFIYIVISLSLHETISSPVAILTVSQNQPLPATAQSPHPIPQHPTPHPASEDFLPHHRRFTRPACLGRSTPHNYAQPREAYSLNP